MSVTVVRIGVADNTMDMPLATQGKLVRNGNVNPTYGSKAEDTHVWVPAEGDTSPGKGQTRQGLPTEGSTLTIHDIHYSVKVKDKACSCSSRDKAILKGIK